MFAKIVHFSIRKKLFVVLTTLLLLAGGIYSMLTLPIDAVPDITNNQVQIVTVSPTLAPQEVEQLITFPIEIAMSNVMNVEEIRSVSRFGLSLVTVVFKENVPTLDARQLVNEQIQMVSGEIPPELGTPELMPITTGLGEIYQYVLKVAPGYEDRYDAMELRTIQDWIVKRQLSGIPGIVEINSFGGYLKQYEVAVDPDALYSLNITIGEVFEALSRNNQNTGGSYIEKVNRAGYTKEELALFFYPILGKDMEFKDFVLMNSRSIFDVKDFAIRANMSLSTFNRRFKETFNATAKTWLLLRKQEFVRSDVTLSTLPFSEIAEKYQFPSTSYLTTFCKKYFGKTPNELRKEALEEKAGQLE